MCCVLNLVIALAPSSCLPLHLAAHSLKQSLLPPAVCQLSHPASRPGSPGGQASHLKGYISIPAVQALPCLLEGGGPDPAEVI